MEQALKKLLNKVNSSNMRCGDSHIFILSKKGLDLASAYSSEKNLITNLNLQNQYIVAGGSKGKKIKMGNFNVRFSKTILPVRHNNEPFMSEAYC